MPQPKTQQELAAEMMRRYRNVFGTEEGKIVLGDILDVAGFGEKLDPNDPAAVSWYNCAIEIARMAGAFDAVYDELRMLHKEK